MSQDPDKLLAEIATLRDEGLRMMDGWDAERRETRRLEAMVVRFQTRSDELKAALEKLEEAHARSLESIEQLRQQELELQGLLARVRDGLRRLGTHASDCPAASRKRDATCECGLDTLAGGDEP